MLTALKREFLFVIAITALTLLLAGCGGGGGGGGGVPTPNTEPLDSSNRGAVEIVDESYRQAAYETNTMSLTVSLHATEREGQYALTLIGADRLHWSQLQPRESSSEIAGDAEADRPFIRGAGVTVGIVDSGIEVDHPDLQGNVLLITSSIITRDDIVDEYQPGNQGHGTRVAGVIAARLNGEGVVGVAPEAKLLAVKRTMGLSIVYDYMAANNAFVVNNSWGPSPGFLKISVGTDTLWGGLFSPGYLPAGEYWLPVPLNYVSLPDENGLLKSFIANVKVEDRQKRYSRLIAAASPDHDDLLIVFAAGNAGWNSHNGTTRYCGGEEDCYADNSRDGVIYLAESNIVSLTIRGALDYTVDDEGRTKRTVYLFPGMTSQVVEWKKNNNNVIHRIPLDYPQTAKNWLNVIAVDDGRVILVSSNGCGDTKDYCLAAPGVGIRTTRLSRPGRADDEPYGSIRQTSAAAPHVSGAAALLKGAFPNLSPQEVAHILLESADGLGDCEGVAKRTSCTDEVYGHGMLNISAAFTPASFIELSGGAGGSGAAVRRGFDIAASRIRLSPAFGAAPWRQESFNVGGLDDYGRVFYTHLDLSDGVYVSKPLVGEDREVKGAGIHRAYAPPLSRPAAAVSYIAADELASAQWRQSAAGIGYGGSQSPHRQSHFVSSRLGNSRLAWHTRLGSDSSGLGAAAGYWQAPFDDGSVHQLQWDYPLAAAAAPQVGIMLGGGDGVHQTAARLQWQGANWTWTAEGGVVREASQVLGASFTGGFSVKGTDTVYRRLRGVYQPASGLHLFADYMQSASEAEGGGGIVRALDARAEAWEAGLSYQRWRFAVSQPLAITAGGLDLSYISGYTAAGAYAVTERRLDLSSGQRARRASLLYVREAIDGLSVALGLDVWRHAPARGYAGNSVVVSGALRYRF